MRQHGVRHLLAAEAGGDLALVSLGDLVVAMIRERGQLTEQLEPYIAS